MNNRRALIFFKRFWVFALLFFTMGALFAQTPSPGPARERLINGINLYGNGRWREAVMELRRAQAEAPSAGLRAEALFWISLSELSAGEYEEALKDMDALAETDPENRRIPELAYHRGRVLYYLGRYDEAIVYLGEYAESFAPGPDGALSPADTSRKAAALYWTGESLFSMGQLDKSADVFKHIVDDYPRGAKYEASVYRLALIDQKKVELELLSLLKWTHEESLRNMEEFRRRESSYDQALNTYQRQIADGQNDTRIRDLEDSNALYREQLDAAEERIRFLENALRETSSSPERARDSASFERLKTLKSSAREIESAMLFLGGDSREVGK